MPGEGVFIPVEVVDQFSKTLRQFQQTMSKSMGQASKSVEKVGKDADKSNKKLGAFFKSAGKHAANLVKNLAKVGAAFVAAIGGLAVRAAIKQEQAVTKLNASLKSLGRFSEQTSKQMQAYAAALQKVTTYGDEAILEVQALIATLGGGTTEQVNKATKATLDMASALGIDLKAAALLMGKAMAGETTTLSRYGIILDENRKKAEGFDYVLEALEEKFGGQAQAMVTTFAGKIQQLKNNMGDMLERALLPTLKEFTNWLNTGDNTEQFLSAVQGAVTAATDAFKWFLELIKDLWPAIQVLWEVLQPVLGLLEGMVRVGADVITFLAGMGTAADRAAKQLDQNYRRAIKLLKNEIRDLNNEQAKYVLNTLRSTRMELFRQLSLNEDAIRQAEKYGASTDGLREKHDELRKKYEEVRAEYKEVRDELKEVISITDDHSGSVVTNTKVLGDNAEALKKAQKAFEDYWKAQGEAFDRELQKWVKQQKDWWDITASISAEAIGDMGAMEFIEGAKKVFESSPLWKDVAKNAGDTFLESFKQSMRSIGDLANALAVAFGESFSSALSTVLHNKLSPEFWKSALGQITSIGIPIIGQAVSWGVGKILSGIGSLFGFGGKSDAEKAAERQRRLEEFKRQTEEMMRSFRDAIAKMLEAGEEFGNKLREQFLTLKSRGADFADVLTDINQAIQDQEQALRDNMAQLAEMPRRFFDAMLSIDGARRSMRDLRIEHRDLIRDLRRAGRAGELSFTGLEGHEAAVGIRRAIREASRARESQRGVIRLGQERDILKMAGNEQTRLLIQQLIAAHNQIALQKIAIEDQKKLRETLRNTRSALRDAIATGNQRLADIKGILQEIKRLLAQSGGGGGFRRPPLERHGPSGQHGFDAMFSGPQSGYTLPVTMHGRERLTISPHGQAPVTNVNITLSVPDPNSMDRWLLSGGAEKIAKAIKQAQSRNTIHTKG